MIRAKNDIQIEDRHISSRLSRRSFLKRFGGGLVIAVAISDYAVLDAAIQQQMPSDLNAYLRIAEDGSVSCFTGKIEMGQGINTSLAQMLAEELDVALEKVTMVMGDTDLCPYDRGTWGSLTTRFFGPPLRAAAAEARAVLLQMASEELSVGVDQLTVEDGLVYNKTNRKKQVSYADLTKGQKIVKSLKGEPKLKDPSEFKVIGKSFTRQDARLKVTGAAIYAGDIRRPGMVYARILRPPSHAATLTSVDTGKAEEMAGVELINQDGLIAVLHESPFIADMAVGKIRANYDIPPTDLDDKTIFKYLKDKAPKPETVENGGNLDEGKKASEHIISTEFHDGYVAHAPMETHSATAEYVNGKMEVWASTQNPFGLKSEIARKLAISEDKVRVRQVFIGGGFGGKSSNGQAVEAAQLAKISGKPVQVVWTRKEEFFYDSFRPAAVVAIDSGVDKDGRISYWDYGVYFAGQRGSEHLYDIPNHRTLAYNSSWRAPKVHPFATGAWRAPGNNTNSFARESQIDIMAHSAGMDPYDFRMKNLTDKRMIRVLKKAEEAFGWKKRKKKAGIGYGLACGKDAGAYVAEMCELEVDKSTGKVRVNRVLVAQDMGLVINPQGATIQAEGCIIMGLGYSLSEDIQFKGGEVFNKNFNDYHLPRFSWIPEIETVLLDLPDEPAQGGGEPAIVAVGGLLANGIFDACGARLTQMPMTPERVLEAIS